MKLIFRFLWWCSADADKSAWRIYWSVAVTKHSTIPYVRYSFLLCKSNFVLKRRRFYDIRLQKCHVLEIGARGHSRSLKVAPFEKMCTVSYWCSLVTLSLKCTVLRYSTSNWRDLENRVRGPSRSPCSRAHMTSYWRSIVTMAPPRVVSEVFVLKNIVILKSGSLRVVSFDRPCVVCY